MRLSKSFEVDRPRDLAVQVLDRDDTLAGLFPDAKTEIVAKEGDRRTVVSQYTALGRSGVATFHFDFLMDGTLRFQKVCDGNVWKELRGEVQLDELAGERVRIEIAMEGRTKGLVPEFTIKGPMQDQLGQMARALRELIEEEPASSDGGRA